MSELIATSLSPRYVSSWGAIEALKEVIQNYLDVTEAQGVQGTLRWADGQAQITDQGSGLEPRHFALGISEKGMENARGQFGEGLKLGLMALARLGRACVVRSNGREYRPCIQMHAAFETETLHLEVSSSRKRVGTEILLECSEEEYLAARGAFQEFAPDLVWLDRERGISSPGGSVYVNGVRAGSVHAQFSYHLTSAELGGVQVINRDRSVVDVQKISTPLATKLGSTNSRLVVRTLLGIMERKGTGERDPLEAELYIASYRLADKDLWQEEARTRWGDALLSSGSSVGDARAERLGYRVLNIQNYTLRAILEICGFRTVKDVLGDDDLEGTPTALTLVQQARLEDACRTVEDAYHRPERVLVLHNPRRHDRDIFGCVLPEDHPRYPGALVLNAELLDDSERLVQELLHETIHQVTGYSDLSNEFEDEYTRLAGTLAQALALYRQSVPYVVDASGAALAG